MPVNVWVLATPRMESADLQPGENKMFARIAYLAFVGVEALFLIGVILSQLLHSLGGARLPKDR
jgi:hypothetical protein